MKLIHNILRFEKHLNGATKLIKKNISDYLIYNTLAMECFQAVNSLIEIGEYIVTKKRFGYPDTYREIFEILQKNNIISNEELKKIKKLIFLRNLIAHEYEKISEEELLEMVNLLEDIKSFVERVKELEKKNE